MDLLEAAKQRHSVRKYTGERIPADMIGILRGEIDRCNAEGGLSIMLITDEPKAFGGIMTRATGFSGAVNYIAMIGPDTPELNAKCGYYGERLALLAQSIGLRTCWAMLCSRKAVNRIIPDGQRMAIGISIGFGADDGKPHRSKTMGEMADISDAPDWFVRGMECVMLAPSGVNRQPIRFSQRDGIVSVSYRPTNLTDIDCGIARFHFELGAGTENFRWE